MKEKLPATVVKPPHEDSIDFASAAMHGPDADGIHLTLIDDQVRIERKEERR